MKARRKARTLALQALYEIDCTSHAAEQVLAERLDDERQEDERLDRPPLDDETGRFAQRIVHGVLAHGARLDQLIHQHAPEWPLDQMAVVDRNILRMAIWEFAVDRSTPIKVAINEAVELAKQFGSDSAPRFVNGVLGALAAIENELVRALASPSQSQ